MADLNSLEASQSVKIAGANPTTGEETFFADVTSEGELKISSFANVSYAAAQKVVNTTPQIAAVGGSNLANRKGLFLYNKGSQIVYYGPSGATVTTGAVPILKDEAASLAFGDNVDVYVFTTTSNADLVIQEFA
jgi:hypothetical protein